MLRSKHANRLRLPRFSSSPFHRRCPRRTGRGPYPALSAASRATPLWHARASAFLPEQPMVVAPFSTRNLPEHSRQPPKGQQGESRVQTCAMSPSPNDSLSGRGRERLHLTARLSRPRFTVARGSAYLCQQRLRRDSGSRPRSAELLLPLAAHLHGQRFFSVLRHVEHLDGHGFHTVVGDPPEEFRLADVLAAEGEDAAGFVGLASVAFGSVGQVVEPDARVLFLGAVVAIDAMPFHLEIAEGEFDIFGDEAAAENRLDLR